MSHEKIDYIAVLHQHGHRMTPQRQAILDGLCAVGEHASFNQIFYQARQLDAFLDPSTVYRALELFVDLGLVVSAKNMVGEEVYEIAHTSPHHHAICRECGLEIKIDNAIVRQFFNQVQTKHDLIIDMDHLIVYGHCPQCQAKK
jgi:Fe2+ or Zn2+ uptake regulation protein